MLAIQSFQSIHAQEQMLTNSDIVQLVQGGLSEDLIIQRIKSSRPGFDLSADQMLRLRAAGVSENILKAMMEASNLSGISSTPPASAVSPIHASSPGAAAAAPSQAEQMMWRQRYGAARSKKNSGWAMFGIGFGVEAGGVLLYLNRFNPPFTVFDPFTRVSVTIETENKGKKNAAIAMWAGGAIFSIWGLARHQSGQAEMLGLEAEGRSKGYISVGPSRDGQGAMLSFNLRF